VHSRYDRSPPLSSADAIGEIVLQPPYENTMISPDVPDPEILQYWCPLPINVDAFEGPAITVCTSTQKKSKQDTVKHQCCGIQVDLASGKSPHTSHPFGLHDEQGDPWNYSVTNGALVLYSKGCVAKSQPNSECCRNCENLEKNANIQGVLQQMEMGVHENTHLAYHGVGGLVTLVRRKHSELKALHLWKLNDAQKLVRKATTIDDLKR
jgi:hypothetical protein